MTPAQYQDAAARTECDQNKSRLRMMGTVSAGSLPAVSEAFAPTVAKDPGILTPIRAMHGVIGIQNELGEITSELQRWIYYGKSNVDTFRNKVFDEGGDLLWHLAELFNALGLSMEAVMEANIAKLKARYPEKWSQDRAAEENRDRVAEAVAQARVLDDPEADLVRPNATGIKPPPLSRSAIEAMRRTPKGCCSRHADNQMCDCLERAVDDPKPVLTYPCCEGAKRVERVPGDATTLIGGDCPTHGRTVHDPSDAINDPRR